MALLALRRLFSFDLLFHSFGTSSTTLDPLLVAYQTLYSTCSSTPQLSKKYLFHREKRDDNRQNGREHPR